MKNSTPGHSLKSEEGKAEFHRLLLDWFETYQRDLPWRRDPSLYKTVVSEFMLQQTRVSTVLPYFESWMEKFPDFSTLAQAEEEEVLKAWEGLGYYSRARNLRKLALEVVTWPSVRQDRKTWESLPGVGPYVAAAVTSISFGAPEAVCDGNVVRILSRLHAISEIFRDGAYAQNKLRPLAQALLETKCPGDFNQAMMELGATVCHKQSPLCLTCPVFGFCSVAKRGDAEAYPRFEKKKKKKKRVVRCWIESSTGILLQKSDNSSTRLAGLYELPVLPDLKKLSANSLLAKRKRTIGQVEYEEWIHRIPPSMQFLNPGKDLHWIDWKKLEEIPLSGPHRKWIRELKPNVEE